MAPSRARRGALPTLRTVKAALLSFALVVMACGPGGPVSRTTAPTDAPSPAPETASPTAAPTPAGPAFLTMTLTDVRSGETFTLGQFRGSVTIVQGMAVW